MPSFDPRSRSDGELWEIILSGNNEKGSKVYEQANAELERRSRKAAEEHARKVSHVAVISAVASVFSAAAAIIAMAIAFLHHTS